MDKRAYELGAKMPEYDDEERNILHTDARVLVCTFRNALRVNRFVIDVLLAQPGISRGPRTIEGLSPLMGSKRTSCVFSEKI